MNQVPVKDLYKVNLHHDKPILKRINDGHANILIQNISNVYQNEWPFNIYILHTQEFVHMHNADNTFSMESYD